MPAVLGKMLTAKHLRIALLPYVCYSALTFLPFTINLRTWKVQEKRSGWHQILQKVWFIWMNIRGWLFLYKAVEVTLNPDKYFEFLPFIFAAGFCTSIISVTIYLAFIKHLPVTISILNALIQEKDDRRKKWWELSMVELFILMTPWNVPVFVLMPAVMNLIAPRAPFTLFSFFPPSYPTNFPLTFVLILADFKFATYICANSYFLVTMLLLFFQKTGENFRAMLKTASQLTTDHFTSRRVDELLKRLGKIRMLILMYNEAYRYVHFAWKICCLLCCILGTSSGMLLIHTNTPIAIVYFLVGSQGGLVYCMLFHKAFSIPMLMTKVRKKVENMSKMHATNGRERGILLKSIRAIPSVAIKVGHFHGFERMSTPNFVGFAVKNITRILIAARNRK